MRRDLTGGADADWAAASDTARARAVRRLEIIEESDRLVAGGLARKAADAAVAARRRLDIRSVQRLRRRAGGGSRAERLAVLLDAGGRGRPTKEWSGAGEEQLWRMWCTDYLRAEAPPAAAVHRRLDAIAARRGWKLPPPHAFMARLRRELSRPEIVRAREGALAAMSLVPHQERTVAALAPLEVINGDGRRLDVIAEWPDGHAGRPHVWIWQDVWSRCVLAWRIGRAETGDMVRLALHDALALHGVPGAVVVDQTLAASTKWMTGGQPSRKRWRSSSEEFSGVLRRLGIRYLPTTVDRDAAGRGRGRGRSKPVERAFGDLVASVEGHPALAGAGTGRSPAARPETHRMRAAPVETVARLMEEAVRAHNERPGRRTEIAAGRSFKAAYEAGVAEAEVTRLTAAQAGLLLLAAEDVAVRADGTVRLRAGRSEIGRNRYYSPGLVELAGQRVVARFDPADLGRPVLIYRLDGAYVAAADLIERVGFLDAEAAAQYERRRRNLRRAAEQGLAARRDMDELLAELEASEAESRQLPLRPPPAPAVVRLAGGIKPPAPPAPREGANAVLAAVRKLRINDDGF